MILSDLLTEEELERYLHMSDADKDVLRGIMRDEVGKNEEVKKAIADKIKPLLK